MDLFELGGYLHILCFIRRSQGVDLVSKVLPYITFAHSMESETVNQIQFAGLKDLSLFRCVG